MTDETLTCAWCDLEILGSYIASRSGYFWHLDCKDQADERDHPGWSTTVPVGLVAGRD